jgi:hypothetical protein
MQWLTFASMQHCLFRVAAYLFLSPYISNAIAVSFYGDLYMIRYHYLLISASFSETAAIIGDFKAFCLT